MKVLPENNFFLLKDCKISNKNYRSISVFEKLSIKVFSYLDYRDLQNTSLVNKELYYITLQVLRSKEKNRIQSISRFSLDNIEHRYQTFHQAINDVIIKSENFEKVVSIKNIDSFSLKMELTLLSSFQYLSRNQLNKLHQMAVERNIKPLMKDLPEIIKIFRTLEIKKFKNSYTSKLFISEFKKLLVLNMHQKAIYIAKNSTEVDLKRTCLLKLISDYFLRIHKPISAFKISQMINNKAHKKLQVDKIMSYFTSNHPYNMIEIFKSIKNEKLKRKFFIPLAITLINQSRLDIVIILNQFNTEKV